MTHLTSERSAAYLVLALLIVLALASAWPAGQRAPQPAEAAGAQLAPVLIMATPTQSPDWTPRPVPPRDAPPALAIRPTPTAEVTPAAAVADAPPAGGASPAPPDSQIVYAADGSAVLPGVDTSWSDAPPAAPPAAPDADAALYTSLPVAGDPPPDGGRPLTRPWRRGGH